MVKRSLDGHHWSGYFRRVFLRQVEVFCVAISDRLLPTFDSLESEADRVTNEEYQRLGQLLGGDSVDMADLAEMAYEEGLAHYEAVSNVRQALLNLAAAALSHLLEQQLLIFHRRQVLFSWEEDDHALFGENVRQKLLKEAGLDITQLASWQKIKDLRLLANAVKHGDGRSASELRVARADLMTHPLFRNSTGSIGKPTRVVWSPLAGDSIFVTAADFSALCKAAKEFWIEFANAVEATTV